VNALLRRASRERGRLPLPAEPPDSSDRNAALAYLAITLSHPRWLAERWLDRVGYDAASAWARFDNEPAPLTLRTNTLRITREALADRLAQVGVRVEPAAHAAAGLDRASGVGTARLLRRRVRGS
jgi:16S rRNA (cytosine967-C5)-methyltransferase